MRSVLITGGRGFLGRPCLAALAGQAGEVHALVRPGAGRLQAGCRGGKVIAHEADLFDAVRVEALVARIRPSHLLHLAWTTEPVHTGMHLTTSAGSRPACVCCGPSPVTAASAWSRPGRVLSTTGPLASAARPTRRCGRSPFTASARMPCVS